MTDNKHVLHEDASSGHLLHGRIRQALPPVSYAAIGRLTETSAETVRRYCTNGTPSLVFIQRICEIWDLNANWLLFGKEPKHGRDIHSQAVAMVSPEPVAGVQVSLLIEVERPDPGAQPAAGAESPSAAQPGPQTPPAVVVHVPGPRKARGAGA